MGNVLGELFGDIADAIREKSGSEGTMKPAAFPEAIRAIQMQSTPTEVEILPETRVEGFVQDGEMSIAGGIADYTLTIGSTYYVVWDGVTCECVGQDMSVMVPGAVGLGNLVLFGGTGNDEPFALGVFQGQALYGALDDAPSHTIRIYQQPQGSLDDLRYVSFLSHDGSQLYGRKPVAVGDDCADPIVRGLFSTPTRDTTAQYTYTFAGWARTANGGMDSTALKTVNENRSLYANFIAAVRYYTVTYYDSDGVTVLKTESLAYGAMPEFVPVKIGYTFGGWTTELQPVTGNVSYRVREWGAKMDFGALSWSQISDCCKTSNVAELFSVGQQKSFTFRMSSTRSCTAIAEIVGFYHDDLADGSGKAPITLRLIGAYDNTHYWHSTGLSSRDNATWEVTELRTLLRTYVRDSSLGAEQDLKNIQKNVTKTYRVYGGGYATVEDNFFLPSLAELGYEIDGAQEGECYEIYSGGKTLEGSYPELMYTLPDGTVRKYWTRTRLNYAKAYGVDDTGKAENVVNGSDATARHPLIFMCIG